LRLARYALRELVARTLDVTPLNVLAYRPTNLARGRIVGFREIDEAPLRPALGASRLAFEAETGDRGIITPDVSAVREDR
jgi:hypothetical protein